MSFMALGMLLCLVSAVVIGAKKSKFKIRCSLVFGAVTITVLVYLQSTANGARIVQSGIVTEAERVDHVVQAKERELFNQHGTLRQQNEESSRLNVNKEEEIVGVSEILEEPTLGSMRETIKNIERNSLVDKENLLNEEIGKTKDPEEHTSVTILPQSPTRKVDDVMMNAPIRHQRSDVIRMFDDAMTDQEMREYIMDKQEGKHFTRHLTPKSADYKFGKLLPRWERREMARYPRIWFVGETSNKTIYDKDDDCNFGFDECNENEGKLRVVIGDHIDFRYEVIKKLGSGSFGTVIQACDHAVKLDNPHRMVAIKIMHNDSSAAKYFKQELNMMKLVEDVTEHSTRFSTTIRTFYFRNHFCFVMELLGESLEDAHEDPLHNIPLLQKYTQDMMDGLVLLHRHNIIHGDMKPENLMFARNCDASCDVYLKLVDYNLACIQGDPDFECPGVYFQTRYYRAPEVIMDLVYGTVADMWSIGVILAELSLGKVPFYGETTVDQLAAIMEVVGLLPPYMVQASPRIHRYQEAVCYKCKNGFKRTPYRKSFNRVFAGLPPKLFDFIQRCLELDPRKRMTSEEALRHPFLNQSETSEGFWAQDAGDNNSY